MIQHKDQRVGVFVDVQNMYYSAKNLYGQKVNFQEILKSGVSGRKLIRAFAYVIRTQIEEEKNFFAALSNQGFELRIKDLQIFVGGQKKGDWDVGLVIDAIRMSSKLDVAVIVSGDGDMIPAVQYLQSLGVLVEIIAFGKSTSAKLIETGDEFLDLSSDEKKYLLGDRRGLGRIVPAPFRGGNRQKHTPETQTNGSDSIYK